MKRSRGRAEPKRRCCEKGDAERPHAFSTENRDMKRPESRKPSVSESEVTLIPQRHFDFRAITEKLLSQRQQAEGLFSQRQRTGLPRVQPNGFTPLIAANPEERSPVRRLRGKLDDTRRESNTADIHHVTTRFESLARAPLFADWKITGFAPNKVILRSLYNMETTEEVSPDIVQFVKERDLARDEMKKAQDELTLTQSKLYDAMQKIEALEKKTKEAETTKPKAKKADAKKPVAKKPAAQNGGLKPSAANTGRSPSALSKTSVAIDGGYHPPVAGIDASADTYEYYWKLAQQYQDLPMFKILDAERKFIKADADSSGYIDRDELDKVLTETVTMFTPKQIDEIFNEIDQDNSGTVDFSEVLVILDKLSSRRRTNLPQSVTQNYSKTCAIQ